MDSENREIIEKPDDADTFVLHEHKITTIDGERIDIPKCSWGKEMKILALMKNIVKAVIDSGVLTGGGASILDADDARRAAEAQVRIREAQEADEEPANEDVATINEVNQKILLDNVKMIAKLVDEVLVAGPQQLGEAVEILTGRDKQWVEDKLESEEMLGMVIPFLYAKRQSIGKVLGRFTISKLANQVAKAVQT
jgi:hypothetical protein